VEGKRRKLLEGLLNQVGPLPFEVEKENDAGREERKPLKKKPFGKREEKGSQMG